MYKAFNSLYKELSTPEQNGKKIGLFRVLCAIFGGLILATLSMTLLVYILPGTAAETITIPILLNAFIWAGVALWISLSPSKLNALLRFVIPSIIISIILSILYKM